LIPLDSNFAFIQFSKFGLETDGRKLFQLPGFQFPKHQKNRSKAVLKPKAKKRLVNRLFSLVFLMFATLFLTFNQDNKYYTLL